MVHELLSQLENDKTDHLFDERKKVTYKELIQKARHLSIHDTKDNWVAIPEEDDLSTLMIKILGAIFQKINFVIIAKSEIAEISLPIISEANFSTNTKRTRRSLPLGDSLFGVQTSGSSGKKKIIVHPVNNLIRSAHQLAKILRKTNKHNWNLSLPAYHIGGLSILFRALVTKSPVQKIGKTDLSQTHFKGIISLVSAQLPALLRNQKISPTEISIHLGGGKANSSLIEKCLEKGFTIFNSYGLSEYCSTFSIKQISKSDHDLSSGFPLPQSSFQLKENQLRIAGPNLFFGTLEISTSGTVINQAKLEKSDLSEELFYQTSDLAVEINGELKLLGRVDEVFVSGGKNVSTDVIREKIELVVKQFPSFSHYYLVTYAHDKWGETYSILIDSIASEIPHDLTTEIYKHLIREYKPNSIHLFDSNKDISGIKPTKDELLSIIEKSTT